MALVKANKGGATPFKFIQAGDTLKGYYQGQVEKMINGSKAVEHTYRTSTGTVGVLGQANILTQLSNNGITPGTYVEITFTGETQKLKGGRTMKVYDVSYDLDSRDEGAEAPTAEEEVEYADDSEETDEPADEVIPSRPVAPKVAAPVADADRKARVQAMLSRTRKI